MNNWVWLPHPAHYCLWNQCRFRLTTVVCNGRYIVSTLGEKIPDKDGRKINRKYQGWPTKKVGDAEEFDYIMQTRNKVGGIGDIIAGDCRYETVVYKAAKDDYALCCNYHIVGNILVTRLYNDPRSAREGHMDLCTLWDQPKEK